MIQEIIEKIEKLPFAGRVTCVDFRTGEEHFIPTDDLKALAAQLSAANQIVEVAEDGLRNVITLASNEPSSAMTSTMDYIWLRAKEALAEIQKLKEIK
jgi:hypothetical protein